MHDIWNYSKDILPSFESQSKLSNPKEENAPAEPMQVCLVGFGGFGLVSLPSLSASVCRARHQYCQKRAAADCRKGAAGPGQERAKGPGVVETRLRKSRPWVVVCSGPKVHLNALTLLISSTLSPVAW